MSAESKDGLAQRVALFDKRVMVGLALVLCVTIVHVTSSLFRGCAERISPAVHQDAMERCVTEFYGRTHKTANCDELKAVDGLNNAGLDDLRKVCHATRRSHYEAALASCAYLKTCVRDEPPFLVALLSAVMPTHGVLSPVLGVWAEVWDGISRVVRLVFRLVELPLGLLVSLGPEVRGPAAREL